MSRITNAKRVFATMHWAVRGIALGALGALVATGQAPTNFWWLALAAMVVAFVALPTTTHARAIWHGWTFGVGYFAISLRWIISPFLVHIERDGWMAPFALILMAGGFALFWALATWITHRAFRWHWLALPLMLTVAEVTRSVILTGFPWALIGHTLVTTPFAQLAAYGGPHLLTLLFTLTAAAIATCRLWTAAPALAAAVIAWPLLTPGATTFDPATATVRLIQPNAPQEEKWDPVMSGVFFDRMLGFTGEGEVPDLVVWPESAIASLLNFADPWLTQMADAARGAPIIVGVNREEAGRYYNSFVHVGRAGNIESFYDKQHLVPFGEYIPGGDLLHRIGIRGFGSSYGGGFTPGDGRRTLNVPGLGPIRPLICYEGIFSEEVGGTEARPRAMILVTNDAWFGKAAGPYQHLAQAQLRAIEQGLPMVRVANTGVSAMIDARGRITGALALNEAGYIDLPLPSALPPTLYARLSDWPTFALLIILLSVPTIGRRQKSLDPPDLAA